MSEFLKYINLTFEIWGILFCVVAVIILFIGTKIEKKTRNHFLSLFLCLAADLCCNIGGLLTKGKADPTGQVLVRVSNFGEFFFSFMMSYLFTLYILHILGGKSNKRLTVWYIIAHALIAFSEFTVIATQFTGWLYTVDGNAMYHRGSFYWLSSVVAIGSLLSNIIVIMIHKNRLRKKEQTALVLYCVLMVSASVATAVAYGINWTLLGFILTAVIMLIIIICDQLDRYFEKERENSEMQSAIMLSQIRPHFLYNSLTSIAQLCEKNPSGAKEAIISFSAYLRGNMNSLTEKKPVPFIREFEHLGEYLKLEKIRFGDLLNIETDIETTDFSLPILSLQPLVENAVKHGVGKKENGGTVKISVRDFETYVEITVEDDGVGFNTDTVLDEKRHIGIYNVRERLKTLCGGSLAITSQIGKGTVCKITLPKGEKE